MLIEAPRDFNLKREQFESDRSELTALRVEKRFDCFHVKGLLDSWEVAISGGLQNVIVCTAHCILAKVLKVLPTLALSVIIIDTNFSYLVSDSDRSCSVFKANSWSEPGNAFIAQAH